MKIVVMNKRHSQNVDAKVRIINYKLKAIIKTKYVSIGLSHKTIFFIFEFKF